MFESTVLPDPLLLVRTHMGIYQVRCCAPVIGESLLLAGCKVIRAKEQQVVRPTWLHQYVRPYCEAMTRLRDFIQGLAKSDPPRTWTGTEPQWSEFADYYAKWLARQGFPKGTVQFEYRDKVLRLLAARGVIQKGVALGALATRKPKKERRTGKKPPPALPLPRFVGLVGTGILDGRAFVALGEAFVEKYVALAAELASGAGVQATIDDYRKTALRLLAYLLQEKQAGRHANLYAALEQGPASSVSQDMWEALLYEWRETERERDSGLKGGRQLKTADAEVRRARALWDFFAHKAFVVKVQLPGFNGSHRISEGSHRPSLAQLFSPELVEGTAKHLVRKFDKSEKKQAIEFVRALCQDVGAAAVSAMSSTELAHAAIDLNDRRLVAIRECAEEDFLRWSNHWRRGQELLAAGGLSPDEVLAYFDAETTMTGERQRSFNRLFTQAPEQVALANAIKLIHATNGGSAVGVDGRQDWLAKGFGGRANLQAYLHPHIEAVTGLYLMLLVDTGANVEVVREMPFDCFGEFDGKGQQHVRFAPKLRAGGKLISDYLCIEAQDGQKLSSVQALSEYVQMSAPMRQLAPADVAEFMLLTWDTGAVVGSAKWYRLADQVERFVHRHWERLKFRFTASSIRVSVLMSVHHHHPAGVQAAKERGDHADEVTTLTNYTGKTPNELLWNAMIREFVDRLEGMVIVTIDKAAAKLGISNEQLDWLVSEGARTGLGIACLNPFAGIQPGTRTGEGCDQFSNCHSCEMRWVVATVENVADMILFNEHLNRRQRELDESDVFAWEQRWLPSLAFTQVALKKLALGDTAPILRPARELAAERRSSYEPFPLF